jgi:hypothetical protein
LHTTAIRQLQKTKQSKKNKQANKTKTQKKKEKKIGPLSKRVCWDPTITQIMKAFPQNISVF